jgi:hypothetical protein
MLKILLILAVLTTATGLGAETERPTRTDVLQMMARIPAKARPSVPGRYDQSGDASTVAQAIAVSAPDRETAALMAVFAAYESSNERCAVGDHGKSLGAWQLQKVEPEVACDPMRAAPIWLARKADSEAKCANLPPDERLAMLASGSCDFGRAISRRRMQIARSLTAP